MKDEFGKDITDYSVIRKYQQENDPAFEAPSLDDMIESVITDVAEGVLSIGAAVSTIMGMIDSEYKKEIKLSKISNIDELINEG